MCATSDTEARGPVLWLLIGLVGSGKTTYSKKLWERAPNRTLRVCLDDIISMMSFYAYDRTLTAFYGETERVSVARALANGMNVIVDRTNLVKSTRQYFITIGQTMRTLARDLRNKLLEAQGGLWGPTSEDELFEVARSYLGQKVAESPGGEDLLCLEAFLGMVERRSLFDRELSLFGEEGGGKRLVEHLAGVANLRIEGIFFRVPPEVCLERRLNDPLNRLRERVRKTDWREVIDRMLEHMEVPSLDEGFDRLIIVDETGKEEIAGIRGERKD